MSLDAADAFKLRVLAVSAFRRLVVTDPSIPAELLPATWLGDASRTAIDRIYRAIAGRSEQFVIESLEPLPTDWTPADVAERFATGIRS